MIEYLLIKENKIKIGFIYEIKIQREEQKAEEEAKLRLQSEFVGEIGDKLTITARLISVVPPFRDYNKYTFTFDYNRDIIVHNCHHWYNPKLIVGETYTFSCTIIKQFIAKNDGAKITSVARFKIVKEDK